MKKKTLFVIAIVVMMMIAATITVMAHDNMIDIEVQDMKRCIPLLAAVASAVVAKVVAIIARKFSDQDAKVDMILQRGAKANSN